jgi:hypothetical protein
LAKRSQLGASKIPFCHAKQVMSEFGALPPSKPPISSEMIRAAKALLRWDQKRLAEASSVSLATVKRLEAKPGIVYANAPTIFALVHALEAAGIEFTNGDRPGVRLGGSS